MAADVKVVFQFPTSSRNVPVVRVPVHPLDQRVLPFERGPDRHESR